MHRLETRLIEDFNGAQVDTPELFCVELKDGRRLGYSDVTAATPAVTSSYDGIHEPQLVLTGGNDLSMWDEERHYPVGRLSKIHGRNLEVLAGKVAIRDQFGNNFSSLCIKGSDFSNPYFMESETASRDHIIHGLQESLVMERVLRASRLLREHGIGAEYICALTQPESFPLADEGSALGDKRPREFGEFLEFLATEFVTKGRNRVIPPLPPRPDTKYEIPKTPFEIKKEMIERFSDCDYLISYRALDCPLRLGELNDEGKFAELKDFVSKLYNDPEVDEHLKTVDLPRFLAHHTIPALAKNLAKMHKLGLTHGFPHGLNVTALGSLVDLDSCKGEALGLGDKRSDEERRRAERTDFSWCINGLEELMWGTDFNHAMIEPLVSHLFKEYLDERFEGQEEKNEFLVSLIIEAYSSTYMGDDAHATYRRVRQVINTYLLYEPDFKDVAGSEIHLPDELVDPRFRRLGSMHFSHLPPAYLKSMRKQIMQASVPDAETDWADMSDEEATVNNLKVMIKNQCLLHFIPEIVNHRVQEEWLTSDQVLFAFGVMLGQIKPDYEDASVNSAIEQTQAYFQEQTKQFLSRLCKKAKRDHVVEEVMDLLDPETEKALVDYTAEAKSGNFLRAPILYLREESEYAKIFEELKIGPDATVEFANYQSIRWSRYGINDTIILTDYKVASLVAAHFSYPYALQEAFIAGNNEGIRPTIVISGIREGKTRVQVVNRKAATLLGHPIGHTQPSSYQGLLEHAFPKTTVPRQLNFRDELTTKLHELVPASRDNPAN